MATAEEKEFLLGEISQEKDLHQKTIACFEQEREKNAKLIEAVKLMNEQKDATQKYIEDIQKNLLSAQKKLVDERKSAAGFNERLARADDERAKAVELADTLTHQLRETAIKLQESDNLLQLARKEKGDDDVTARFLELQRQIEKAAKDAEQAHERCRLLAEERNALELKCEEYEEQVRELTQEIDATEAQAETDVELQRKYAQLLSQLDEEKVNIDIANETIAELTEKLRMYETGEHGDADAEEDEEFMTSTTSTTSTTSKLEILQQQHRQQQQQHALQLQLNEEEAKELKHTYEALLSDKKVLEDIVDQLKTQLNTAKLQYTSEHSNSNSSSAASSEEIDKLKEQIRLEKETAVDYQTKYERTTRQLNMLKTSMEEEAKRNHGVKEELESKISELTDELAKSQQIRESISTPNQQQQHSPVSSPNKEEIEQDQDQDDKESSDQAYFELETNYSQSLDSIKDLQNTLETEREHIKDLSNKYEAIKKKKQSLKQQWKELKEDYIKMIEKNSADIAEKDAVISSLNEKIAVFTKNFQNTENVLDKYTSLELSYHESLKELEKKQTQINLLLQKNHEHLELDQRNAKQIEAKENELHRLTKLNRDQAEDLEAMHQDFEAMKDRLGTLQTLYDEQKELYKQLKLQKSSLSAAPASPVTLQELEVWRAKVSKLNKEVDEHVARIKELESYQESFHSTLEEFEFDRDEVLRLNKLTEKQSGELETTYGSLNKLQALCNEQQKKLDQPPPAPDNSQIAELADKVEKLEQDNTAYITRINELEIVLETTQNDLSESQSLYDEQKELNRKLRLQPAPAAPAASASTSTQDTSPSDVAKYVARIKELENENENYKNTAEAIEQLEKELVAFENQDRTAKRMNERASDEIASLKQDLKISSEEAEIMKEELDMALSDIKELEGAAAKHKEEVDALKEALEIITSESKDKIELLEKELATVCAFKIKLTTETPPKPKRHQRENSLTKPIIDILKPGSIEELQDSFEVVLKDNNRLKIESLKLKANNEQLNDTLNKKIEQLRETDTAMSDLDTTRKEVKLNKDIIKNLSDYLLNKGEEKACKLLTQRAINKHRRHLKFSTQIEFSDVENRITTRAFNFSKQDQPPVAAKKEEEAQDDEEVDRELESEIVMNDDDEDSGSGGEDDEDVDRELESEIVIHDDEDVDRELESEIVIHDDDEDVDAELESEIVIHDDDDDEDVDRELESEIVIHDDEDSGSGGEDDEDVDRELESEIVIHDDDEDVDAELESEIVINQDEVDRELESEIVIHDEEYDENEEDNGEEYDDEEVDRELESEIVMNDEEQEEDDREALIEKLNIYQEEIDSLDQTVSSHLQEIKSLQQEKTYLSDVVRDANKVIWCILGTLLGMNANTQSQPSPTADKEYPLVANLKKNMINLKNTVSQITMLQSGDEEEDGRPSPQMKNAIEQFEQENSKIVAEIAVLKKDQSKMKLIIEKQQTYVTAQLAPLLLEINAQIDVAIQQRTELAAQLKERQEQYSKTSELFERIQTEYEIMYQNYQTTEQQTKTNEVQFKENLTSLESQIQQLQKENLAYKEKQHKLDTAAGSAEQHQLQQQKLNEDLQKNEKERKLLQEEVGKLKTQVSNQQRQLQQTNLESQQEIEKLKQQLGEQQIQLDNSTKQQEKEKMKENTDQQQQQQQQQQKMSEELQKNEKERTLLQEEINKLKNQLTKQQRQLQQIENESQQEIDKLKQQLIEQQIQDSSFGKNEKDNVNNSTHQQQKSKHTKQNDLDNNITDLLNYTNNVISNSASSSSSNLMNPSSPIMSSNNLFRSKSYNSVPDKILSAPPTTTTSTSTSNSAHKSTPTAGYSQYLDELSDHNNHHQSSSSTSTTTSSSSVSARKFNVPATAPDIALLNEHNATIKSIDDVLNNEEIGRLTNTSLFYDAPASPIAPSHYSHTSTPTVGGSPYGKAIFGYFTPSNTITSMPVTVHTTPIATTAIPTAYTSPFRSTTKPPLQSHHYPMSAVHTRSKPFTQYSHSNNYHYTNESMEYNNSNTTRSNNLFGYSSSAPTTPNKRQFTNAQQQQTNPQDLANTSYFDEQQLMDKLKEKEEIIQYHERNEIEILRSQLKDLKHILEKTSIKS